MKRARLVALLGSLTICAATARGGPAALPIYRFEDSHAGSFYWLAEHIPLEEKCTLLHFDAHSDASGIFDSDKIRASLRQVHSVEERHELLERWRGTGAIQCFSWIEPLMPRPITRAIWITDGPADTAEAIALLDGHLEAAPRAAGSFSDRFSFSDLAHLPQKVSREEPVIVTIDLDSFSGSERAEQTKAFMRVWDFVMEHNVRAITFAISRPYLQSDAEADWLLTLALKSARLLPTARIQFEPFAVVAHDHSLRAREFQTHGESVPSFDITRASEPLKALLLAESHRLIVEHDSVRWEKLLAVWRTGAAQVHLQLKDRDPSTDGAWRISFSNNGRVELAAEPWTSRPSKVEWSVLLPANDSCNVSRLDSTQVGFVGEAAARPRWVEKMLPGTGTSLSLGELNSYFDAQLHCGSVRLRARATFGETVRETPVMELRCFAGAGFRAAITEQFGLPYLFGGGELAIDGETGAETNLGTDCANFIVYAMRRQGLRVSWCDPKQLQDSLQLVADKLKPGEAHFTPAQLETGLVVHLGSHVAAVLEDRPPLGLLDGDDIVAHQLKTRPEAITLAELLQSRGQASFDLFAVPAQKPDQTLTFGGDLMLGRSCAERIRGGLGPFASLRQTFSRSCFVAANLECVLTEQNHAPKTRYAFGAPIASIALLRRAGFRAVGLANNHALDFGRAELQRCANRLHEEHVQPVGLPAESPAFFDLPGGKRLALFAIADLPGNTQSDRSALESALRAANTTADVIVCLVHWGEENTPHPTERQRELARWLVAHGVDAIAGTHPHCLQPLDFYHGRPIAYSLGNLVFDGADTVPSWNRGALLQLGLSQTGKINSTELRPIRLEQGLPKMESPAAADALAAQP